MKKLSTWFDVLENGQKDIFKRDEFQEAVKGLKPGRYIYSIEKVENIRSKEQNNALWGIPYMYYERVLVELGHFKDPSKKQIHEWCMHYCLPEDYKERVKKEYDQEPALVDLKTGELFKSSFRLTTTKMSTRDAMNYYENLQNFYAENLSSGEEDQIPDPDKNWKDKLNKLEK